MYNVNAGSLMQTIVPQQTRTYKPISHKQLIDLTFQSVISAGFQIEKQEYTAARDNQIATGRYTISNVNDSEMKLEIAWQNSYNKSVTLKFAIGARVIICQNGMVHGDMGSLKKKHTGDVQEFAPAKISDYIKQAGDVFTLMQKERDAMKNIELTKRVTGELLGRMFIEESFIQSTQLNIIAREIEKPSYDYGHPNTLWELYNHTTHSMKPLHPSLWMKSHMDAHSWFVNESGALFTPKTNIIVTSPLMSEPKEEMFMQLEMFNNDGLEQI